MIYTIGHSNRPRDDLVGELMAAGIELLADVRRHPASQRNPRFDRDALAAALAAQGIGYHHFLELGGRRLPGPDSPNTALRDRGFRGFADYMMTIDFDLALSDLIAFAAMRRTAIMCAEAVPWRCHRSLIADSLVARGIEVHHLIGGKERVHALSATAHLDDGRVAYPAML